MPEQGPLGLVARLGGALAVISPASFGPGRRSHQSPSFGPVYIRNTTSSPSSLRVSLPLPAPPKCRSSYILALSCHRSRLAPLNACTFPLAASRLYARRAQVRGGGFVLYAIEAIRLCDLYNADIDKARRTRPLLDERHRLRIQSPFHCQSQAGYLESRTHGLNHPSVCAHLQRQSQSQSISSSGHTKRTRKCKRAKRPSFPPLASIPLVA